MRAHSQTKLVNTDQDAILAFSLYTRFGWFHQPRKIRPVRSRENKCISWQHRLPFLNFLVNEEVFLVRVVAF